MAPNLSKTTTDLLGDAAAPVEGLKAPSRFTLKGKDLAVDGHPFLLDVPANIRLTPASTLVPAGGDATAPAASGGSFLGFDAPAAKSRHVVPVGRLRDTRFMSIFRFKVWWTTHWVGDSGRDVENETQMMVLDRSAAAGGGRPYVLLLPIVEGSFRACLESGKVDDYVDMVVESGSSAVRGAVFRSSLYLHAGDDPFELVKEAVRVVRAHLGTFRTMDEKTPPPIVDKFGWCTWDAFYLKVHPEGVWEGVRRLAEGGCPPGLVLIDDGWQSICHDEDDPASGEEGMNRTSAGEQMPCRLIKFQENHKFREYKQGGMGAFVREMKEAFPTVEQVYVWHALCGYWGGLRPGADGLPPAKVVAPKLSPGLQRTMEDLAVDKIVNNGVGLVDPKRAQELYEGLHSHLAASGIDGVKVDVIHLLEMMCEEYGGRVELAKAYFAGLTASVRRHFGGNGVIASMEHCNDFMLLGTEAVALGRVGDDFWCTDPSGDPNGTFWLQGCHMVHCAYNSLWMGNFIHPDWDMFQSTHPCAAFHAASRAVSGGPVYVSDSVGQHDFALLRRLALPDGTILRCEGYALPARDCLFADPLHDGRTVLKIWNVNRFAGVVGAFNCQGGGWSPEARRNKCFSEYSVPLAVRASPADVEWKSGKGPGVSVKGVSQFAVYMVEARKLQLLRPDDGVDLTLAPFTYELLVVAPVRVISPERAVKFAPIGLANMLNTAGAVQVFETKKDSNGVTVEVAVKGAGEMVAYSSARPRLCRVNGEEAEFAYKDGMVTVDVPWSGSSSKLCRVEYVY